MLGHLRNFVSSLALLAAFVLLVASPLASAQSVDPAQSVIKVPDQDLYIRHVAGQNDNVYEDSTGNLYSIAVKPLNSTSCDSSGCTVTVCKKASDTPACEFYRCTPSGGCKRLIAPV